MKKFALGIALLGLMASCGDQIAQQSNQAHNNSQARYNEPHRPQFHFSPPEKWMNDPNGMVYYEGEYHLFYQHYPDSTVWGPMHWGHAVSSDMVHWENLPIALYPDSLGWIFSGSAVVDWHNTSGLGSEENPPLVAIYTYHNMKEERAGKMDYQTQGIAYSLDKGRSWTKYEQNPVLENPGIRDFRDPKVSWNEDENKWVMALAVADRISFYSSSNLKDWQHESDFGSDIGAHGGVWECPDLFKMKVEGSEEEKWVLLVSINPGGPNGGSATQYFVGDFDGSTFTLDERFRQDLTTELPLPEGKIFADFEGANYAAWKAEGDAFGKAPVAGAFPGQQKVNGFEGKKLVNSFRNGDNATGSLSSADFKINSDFINIKIGGGKHPEGTAVNLLVEGKTQRTATGKNSESLDWVAWDTRGLKGKVARIEIVDKVEGGWGHILVDHILFSDTPAQNKAEGIWVDYGRDNYAGVSWSDIPVTDGRRLFIGWMSNWDYANVVPTENWRSAMTVARSLNLENTPHGYRLSSKPVKELENIFADSFSLKARELKNTLSISEELPFSTPTYALDMELEVIEQGTGFTIELSNTKGQKMRIGYDPERQAYFTDRTQAGEHAFSDNFGSIQYGPRIASGPEHSLRLLVDVSSSELFADGGKTVMTDIFFPDEDFTNLSLKVTNGQLRIKEAKVTNLKSIWNANQ